MFPSDPPVQPKRANATLRSTVLLLVPLKVFLFTSSPCHECYFYQVYQSFFFSEIINVYLEWPLFSVAGIMIC
ncbi:hypothetical protein V8C43DRAFT_292834 [Trichoderma afarasin]